MSFYYDNKLLNILRTRMAFWLTVVISFAVAYKYYSGIASHAPVGILCFISATTGLGFSVICLYLLHMDLSSIGLISDKASFKKALLVGSYSSLFSGGLTYFLFTKVIASPEGGHVLSFAPFVLGISIGCMTVCLCYKLYTK